ncbi:MAG TPA: cyclase family protein [Chloroflexia bacterium]|nr:cyclase family protein [Chloroflexia bacterium]
MPSSPPSALARITPLVVARAALLAQRGQVYDLGAELSDDMPATDKNTFMPYRLLTYRSFRDFNQQGETGDVSFYTEVLMATPHVSTHIDALNHVSKGGRIFGGHRTADVEHDFGVAAASIETVPPIVTRGVLLDIAATLGVERIADHYAITVADLEQTLARQGTRLAVGDAVLVHTGKMRQYAVDNAAFLAGQPGVGLAAALWLYDQGMAVLGSDTTGTEPQPVADWEQTVHVAMLMERGVHLIEWMHLEALAAAGVYEFLFFCAPLKLRGASGSWVRPVAIA